MSGIPRALYLTYRDFSLKMLFKTANLATLVPPLKTKAFYVISEAFLIIVLIELQLAHSLFLSSVPGRTFPTHPYFQAQLGAGQLSLYNLLKAYSLLDPEVSFVLLVKFFLAFVCLSCLLDSLNGTVICLLSPPTFFSVDVNFVVLVLVGGVLPGTVLHCWSAAVTHGGRGCLQHAEISNV